MKNYLFILLCYFFYVQSVASQVICNCDPRVIANNPAQNNTPINLSEFGQKIPKVEQDYIKIYKSANTKTDIATFAISANQYILDKVFEIGGGAAASPIAKILFTGTEELNEVFHTKVKNQLENDRKKVLEKILSKMHKNVQNKFTQIRGSSSNEEFFKFLEDNSNEYKSMIDKMKAEGRSEDIIILNEHLNEVRYKETQFSFKRTNENVSKLAENVMNMDKGIKQYMEEQKILTKKFQESQKKIHQNLEVINKATIKNSQDLEFLKSFAYNRMTPSEKKEAIRSKLIYIPTKDTAQAIAELNTIIASEIFLKTAEKILYGGSNLLNIMKNIGIEGDFIEDGYKALNAGQNILAGVSSLLSPTPDYLGAISSFSNLLGIGGNRANANPVSNQLKQIQKTLNHLVKQTEVINEKLDTIAVQIERTQQLIVKGVNSLHEHIEKSNKQIYDKLEEMHQDIRYTQEMINDRFSERPSLVFWNAIDELYDKKLDTIFIPNKNSFEYQLGLNINEIFKEQKKVFESTFIRKPNTSYITDELKVMDKTNAQFANQYSDLFTAFYNLINRSKQCNPISLYLPFTKLSHLPFKLNDNISIDTIEGLNQVLKNYITKERDNAIQNNDYRNKHNLIHPSNLEFYSHLLIKYTQLSNYLKYSNTYATFQHADMKEMGEGSIEVFEAYFGLYEQLWNAFILSNVAIFQQVLYSGDVLIPYYVDLFDKGFQINDDVIYKGDTLNDYRSFEKLIANNQLFRINFIKYMINNRLKKVKSSLVNYQLLYDAKNLTAMKLLLKYDISQNVTTHQPINIILEKGIFFLQVGKEQRLPLPSPADLKEDLVAYSPSMYNLIKLKRDILDQLTIMSALLANSKLSQGRQQALLKMGYFSKDISLSKETIEKTNQVINFIYSKTQTK